MNKILYAVATLALSLASRQLMSQPAQPKATICNPLNLSYRFCLDTPSRREAADPAMVNFHDQYYLFASKSGGYWHSKDLFHWDFITSADLPFEDYAPAILAMNDRLYFMASSSGNKTRIYRTADPLSGKWTIANDAFPIVMTDPDLFLDDDGRLYFYYGCSDKNPIYGVELDTATLMPIGKPVACLNSHRDSNGWERPGDFNDKQGAPWIEGSWMTKHNGKYYLQYAAPGTQFKSYADGLYTASQPLGPFTLAPDNPVSSKPSGFVAGAGHSSSFQDNYGNYWHISTMSISVKHMFERRLGLFPMFFDKDGELYTYTGFGDWPFLLPEKKISGPGELFPSWMLLSYNKPVKPSSELPGHPAGNATDEEIRTYWAAASGSQGEWFQLDLQRTDLVQAIQINFAEHNTHLTGRPNAISYQYLLEYSTDGTNWKAIADKRSNQQDQPHDYIQLDKPVRARYLRITNYHIPDGNFALSDLRVFGHGTGTPPARTPALRVLRNQADPCQVTLSWDPASDASGYNIRFGTAPGKLYHNYQVLGANSVTINSLDAREKYYFAIDAFNDNGITRGK